MSTRRRKLTPKQKAQKGGLTTAQRAATQPGGLRAMAAPARAGYWRKLGADLADDGTLLDTEATRQAKRLFRLRMLGGAL